jgi:type IV pilus assembly protein PilF
MIKAIAKNIRPIILTAVSLTLLSGCVTQSFENNEPIVKTQANRDEMAATRISLGLGYLRMGNMSQAKLNLEKAKTFSPGLVQVHTAFAHYYETVGENELAIESFEQALTIKSDSADTLNNYGVFLCRQDNIDAAEVQFLKAIAVPSYLLVSQSYENLASCYLQSDDFEKAEMYLNKAIFHSPNRTATLLQMVRLQYAMGDYQESKRFLQKFERNTQRFTADSLALSYKIYRKLGKRRTASNYGNMLVKMYPQSWEGKQYLLNELNFIEADELAKKYQRTQREKNNILSPSSNKRVVKLSPKKAENTPFTHSVNTSTEAIKIQDVAVTAPTTAAVTTSVATSSLPIITTAQPVSGEALLPTAVIGSNTVTSSSKNDTVVAKTEETLLLHEPIAQVTPIMNDKAVYQQPDSSIDDPISTQPVPATRDVPLPEALPEPVPEKIVIESVAVKEVSKSTENIDVQEVLHTVTPGESLYSISMKYNVKIKALHQWNNISEKNKIRIGDKLYVVDPQTVKNINE